jgi:hypothetical protein
MKFTQRLMLAATLLALPLAAIAQTNVPPLIPYVAPTTTTTAPTTQSFVQSALDYVSSFNTNLNTFSTNANMELWTGVGFEQGTSVGALTGFDIAPIAKLPGLYLGNMTTFSGVIGTVASTELDAGYAYVHYDLKIKVFLGADAQFADDAGNTKGMRGSVGTQWEKALTDNSFAGIRAEDIYGGPKNELLIALITGFTF